MRQLCASRGVSPLQSFSGSCLKCHGCIGVGTRSLASCIACPACVKKAFMLTSSRTTLLMPRNISFVATGLVAFSSSTTVSAWPRHFRLLSYGMTTWHELPRFPGRDGGSALQSLRCFACVLGLEDSFLSKRAKPCTFCMASAPCSVKKMCHTFEVPMPMVITFSTALTLGPSGLSISNSSGHEHKSVLMTCKPGWLIRRSEISLSSYKC